MELNKKNFCPNVINLSDSLRIVYTCAKTGKICPKVDYSSGKPLPSNDFYKNGCNLIEKKIKEEKKIVEAKEIKVAKVVEEVIIEPEEEKEEQPKNNFKKKKKKNK